MKKLGHHFVPTDSFLIDFLRRKVCQGAVDIKLPVIERKLYSGEPWEILKDNDPWDVLHPTDKATDIKRVIFVFTDLKPTGKKRFVRTAGDGTWHGSTAEKPVRREDGSILMDCCKSYLDFRPSKNPESREKGHWMMHEYKLKGLESMIPAPANINTVLCRITHVVNKDLGIHHTWPKSPFEICFRNFKSQGFFAIRPNKRQEPSAAAAADDEQIQQPKRRQLEAASTSDDEQVPDLEQIENDSQMVAWGDEEYAMGFNAEEVMASLVQNLPEVDEDMPPIYKMHIPLPWEDDDNFSQQPKSWLSDLYEIRNSDLGLTQMEFLKV